MKITPIFNAAAQGGDPTSSGDDPLRPDPSGPGTATASAEEAARQDASEEAASKPSREFEAAAILSRTEPEGPHPGMTWRSDPEAQALLEALEAGRPEFNLNHRLRPSPRIERDVHIEIEEERQKMIEELRNQLEADIPLGYGSEVETDDSLEFML